MAAGSPFHTPTENIAVLCEAGDSRGKAGWVPSVLVYGVEMGHPDRGPQQYTWLLHSLVQTKVLPQKSQLLAGPFENGLKSHCSHILFYEHHQGRKEEKKNSIHEMERQRILINSIIGAKAIMLHVL